MGIFSKVGGVARVLDCDPQTVRRLDRMGLFLPRRNRRGHRVYDAADIDALRALRATIRTGPKPKDPTAVPRRRKKRLGALARSGVGSVPSPSLAGPAGEAAEGT